MYFIKGIIIILLILFCSIEVGKLWYRKGNYLESSLTGFITMMALFNLLCIPMHILEVRFSILCMIYSIILIAMVICSLSISILRRKRFDFFAYKLHVQLFLLLALVLIGYQIWRLITLQPVIYGDDETYLTMVNDIVGSDHIQGLRTDDGTEVPPFALKYMATSYYPFLAYWCKIFHFHPLLLCKTFFPVLTTLLAYGVFWLLAERFFHDNMRKKSMFLLLVVMFVEFENISYHFFSRKYLLWPWQGKSVLYTILMPFLFYLLISYLDENADKKKVCLLATALFANGAVSLMGVGYSTIIVVIFGVIRMIQLKKWQILLQTLFICLPTGIVLIGAILTS